MMVCLQYGRTCVHSACRGGNVEVVKYLLERGGEEMLMRTDTVSAFLFQTSGMACDLFEAKKNMLCLSLWRRQAGMIGFITLQQSAPSQMTLEAT